MHDPGGEDYIGYITPSHEKDENSNPARILFTGDGMIDHIAMKHVKNYYLRVGIVIVWNLLGMVTMWWAMMSGYSLDNLAVIGGGMFLAGCFALAYKARVPEEHDE